MLIKLVRCPERVAQVKEIQSLPAGDAGASGTRRKPSSISAAVKPLPSRKERLDAVDELRTCTTTSRSQGCTMTKRLGRCGQK